MQATIGNMIKADNNGEGAIAYSPVTGEEYSAHPGDYWDIPKEYCLKDSNGDCMILVRRVVQFVEIDL